MKGKTNSSLLGTLSIILAGILWGTMGLWVHTFSGNGLDSMQILGIRMVLTMIFLGGFLLAYDRRLFCIKGKDLWCFIGTGVFSIVFFGYCYNQTILMTSLSTAAILLYTAPIFVTILSRIFFAESLTKRKLIALGMAFAGCAFVSQIWNGAESLSAAGLATGLASGFGYALYSIFSRFALNRGYHPFTITFYTFLCGTVTVLFLADWSEVLIFAAVPAHLLYAVCYALVTTTLAYIFYTLGLSHVENSKASIMATIEPVVATLLGVFVLHETMTPSGLIGVILVLGAVIMLQ